MTRRQPHEYDFVKCLFDETILPVSPRRITSPRRQKVSFIVLHHMAMVGHGEDALTACSNAWLKRAASAHYGVADGFIRQYVWDRDEAWATANSLGNQAGISIEHANSTGGPTWQVSPDTLLAGAKLVAALHHFHNLGRPVWGKTLFQHSNFYNTACAGPYLGHDVLPQYVAQAQHQYDILANADTPAVETPMVGVYKVKPGDTLTSIARKYRVTVEQLVFWNHIKYPNQISVGQTLLVTAPAKPIPLVSTKPLPNPVTINDKKILEASGMVLSVKNPGCYWICNDENGPIYLVRISDGKIVGSVVLKGVKLIDPESLAIDYTKKTLVVCDGGNNDGKRKTGAFYTLDEPQGLKKHGELPCVKTTWKMPKGANFECLIIDPSTGQKWLVSKDNTTNGRLYKFVRGELVLATAKMPKLVSDGCYSPSGKFTYYVAKSVDKVYIYDKNFHRVTSIPHPDQPQPETIALYPNGIDVMVGSEGKKSKLQPVRIPAKYL